MKENSKPQKPTLLNLTEAGHLLGYQNATVIKNLIGQGLLKTYMLPDSSRVLVCKEEVQGLVKPVIKTPKNDDSKK